MKRRPILSTIGDVEITASNAKEFITTFHVLDASVLNAIIQDLGSSDDEVRLSAYSNFGIDENGNPSVYNEPSFFTKECKHAYLMVKKAVIESVKNGTIEEYIKNAKDYCPIESLLEVRRNEG